MAVIGTTRTFADVRSMSATQSKPDIRGQSVAGDADIKRGTSNGRE